MRFGYKKNIFLVCIIFFSIFFGPLVKANLLQVNPVQSSILFKVNQFGTFPVEGKFSSYSANIKLLDIKTIEKVEVVIDVNSLSTNIYLINLQKISNQ